MTLKLYWKKNQSKKCMCGRKHRSQADANWIHDFLKMDIRGLVDLDSTGVVAKIKNGGNREQ